MHRQADGQADEQADGQADRQADGQADRQADGQLKGIFTIICKISISMHDITVSMR